MTRRSLLMNSLDDPEPLRWWRPKNHDQKITTRKSRPENHDQKIMTRKS